MARQPSRYEEWVEQEGVPIIRGYGVSDVMSLELGPWARLGGNGAIIDLVGMEGLTGMYVAQIPPGGALVPERHLYEELIYVLRGRGSTRVWSAAEQQEEAVSFDWQAGSLFATPLNTWHQLVNGSQSDPAWFLAVTTAPIVMDLYRNLDFVFQCDFNFTDRFDSRKDYFEATTDRRPRPDGGGLMWLTNLIPDVLNMGVDVQGRKGKGIDTTQYEMAGNILVGHVADWPVGRYHKGHYHGGGAILLILRSSGYTLMWPKDAGIHPYQDGRGEKVVRVDWQPGSVLSPPTEWFHQHFNVGSEPARQLALRYGSKIYGVGFHDVHSGKGALLDIKQGGTMIESEDEDTEMARQFRQATAEAGTTT